MRDQDEAESVSVAIILAVILAVLVVHAVFVGVMG